MSKKNKDKKAQTNGQGTSWWQNATSSLCHTGNFRLLTVKDGGSLYCGGWSKHATYGTNTVVIDLTGKESPEGAKQMIGSLFDKFLKQYSIHPAGWLSLEMPDFQVPDLTIDDWKVLAADIKAVLQSGKDVLIACMGGHGRTGITVSILMKLLEPTNSVWNDPVHHLRKIYCKNAVDTAAQEAYVYKMLGLKLEVDQKAYQQTAWTPAATSGPTNASAGITHVPSTLAAPTSTQMVHVSGHPKLMLCPVCHSVSSADVGRYGLCGSCQEKWGKIIAAEAKKKGKPETTIQIYTMGKGCACGDPMCDGIVKGSCGHVVHDQPAAHGQQCDACFYEKRDQILSSQHIPSLQDDKIGGTNGDGPFM